MRLDTWKGASIDKANRSYGSRFLLHTIIAALRAAENTLGLRLSATLPETFWQNAAPRLLSHFAIGWPIFRRKVTAIPLSEQQQ